jgi:hypothetical protein
MGYVLASWTPLMSGLPMPKFVADAILMAMVSPSLPPSLHLSF